MMFAGGTAIGTELPIFLEQIAARAVQTAVLPLTPRLDAAQQQKSGNIAENQDDGRWAERHKGLQRASATAVGPEIIQDYRCRQGHRHKNEQKSAVLHQTIPFDASPQ